MLSFQGEAEQRLRAAFEEATRRAPCVLLLDDMDLLCCQRSRAGVSDLQKRIVSCILSLVDGLNESASSGRKQRVLLIGTTARPGDIDAAVRRSGRVDQEVELGVPGAAERELLLRHLLAQAAVAVCSPSEDLPPGCTFSISAAAVGEVARLAHGMVGADLLLVVKEAFFLALGRWQRQGEVTASNALIGEAEESAPVNLADEFGALSLDDDEGLSLCRAEDTVPAADRIQTSHTSSGTVAALPATLLGPAGGVGRALLGDQDLREALSRVSPSALREVVVEVPAVRWTDIGGMAAVKQSLREVSLRVRRTSLAVADSRGLQLPRWWSCRCSGRGCLRRWASRRRRAFCCTGRRAARRRSWPRRLPRRAP